MPLRRFRAAMSKRLDDTRTAAQQNIPAENLQNQIAPNNLGPRGNTGAGYSPAAHASSHEDGGDDALDLGALAGELTDGQHGDRAGGTLHAVATDSVAGFMSAADKAKEDGYPDLTGLTPGYVLTALTSTTADFAPASGGGGLPVGAPGDMFYVDPVGTVVLLEMSGVALGSAIYATDVGGDQLPAWDIRPPVGGANGDLDGTYPDPTVIGLRGVFIDSSAASPSDGDLLRYDAGTSRWQLAAGGAGTVTSVDITAPSAGITASGGPVTGAGAIILALADDLAALEALNSTGIAVRSAANTWLQRAIAGTSNRISVTNGDGVSGNPTLDISTSYVGQASITTLGTIGSGAWQGTKVGLAYGGTNADLSATGGANQFLRQGSAGAAITVGSLVSGDIPDLSAIYQPLDADLTALAALSGTGIAARTAANTWAQRTITGTTNRLSVTNGNGVSGNPTLDISTNYAGQSTIDTVGTISSGDWRGTPITVGYGGTGLTSYAVGDLIYASASTTLSKLADVATGNVLLSGGVTTAPAYGKVGLTTHVSGLLGQANGGVGADLSATGGAGQYLKQISSGAAITVGAIPATDLTYSGLTTGQIFQATSASAAGFAALNLATAASITGILPSANGGTGVNNGSNLLTVPATGTAALRDVANTFTAAEIVNVTDAATAGNTTLMTFAHNSSGTPAVGFGSDISWLLGDSTTPNTAAALIRTSWATATHGSQKAQLSFFVYDTAARNAFRMEASGAAAMVGFMGAAPVTRPNITGVSSGTPTAAQMATLIRNILTAVSSLGLATDSTT